MVHGQGEDMYLNLIYEISSVFFALAISCCLLNGQESTDQHLYLQYKAASIGVEVGNEVMIIDLSVEKKVVKYISRHGKRGEMGEVSERLLFEHFIERLAPDGGRVLDKAASHLFITGGNLKIEWSEGNGDGGWLYIPKGYKIFVYTKGSAENTDVYLKSTGANGYTAP